MRAPLPDVAAIRAAATDGPEVERIIHMRTLYLGPDELLVGMKIAVPPTSTAADVAAAIDAVERRVRDAVPIARALYLEPDIDRGVDAVTADQRRAEASTPAPG